MSCENCEESAYVIDKLAKLLAEIAVIVNGVEPHDTSWSYHDLPEKVRALKQAQKPAAAVPEALIEWAMTDDGTPDDSFDRGYKAARRRVRMMLPAMLATERKGVGNG